MKSRKMMWKVNKQQRLQLLLVMLLLCVVTSLFSFLTTYTEAKFLYHNKDAFHIQIGTWWDGSDLSISDAQQDMHACPTYHLTFTVENSGFAMLDGTSYQLFYSPASTPSDDGAVIKEAVLSALPEQSQHELFFTVAEEGNYQLKVDQRPMYQDDELNEVATWSSVVEIMCEEEEEVEVEDQDKSENQLEKPLPKEPQQEQAQPEKEADPTITDTNHESLAETEEEREKETSNSVNTNEDERAKEDQVEDIENKKNIQGEGDESDVKSPDQQKEADQTNKEDSK